MLLPLLILTAVGGQPTSVTPPAPKHLCVQLRQYLACDLERIEADNGQVYLVDRRSIEGDGSIAQVVFYTMIGEHNIDLNGNWFRFGCKEVSVNGLLAQAPGQYSDLNSGLSGYAPPKSVLGEIGRIACRGK